MPSTPERRRAARTDALPSEVRPPTPPSTTTSVPLLCHRTTPGSGAERSGTGAFAMTTATSSGPSTSAHAAWRSVRWARLTTATPRPSGEQADVDAPELAERSARRAAGNQLEPAEREPGRTVQERGQRIAGCARHHPRRQAPHHHQPRHGHGQQVGGQRRDRDRAERAEQHGCDTELRGQRHRERVADACGAREAPPRVGGATTTMAVAAHTDSWKPTDSTEQGVDEEQPGDGQRDHAHPGHRPARHRDRRGQRRHRRRPQHRRLEAGHDPEQRDHGEGHEQPGPQPQAPQHRPGERQRERDVLPRHGEQVREPGAPEGIGEVGGLLPVVAEDQSSEERPLARIQGRGSGDQGAPQPVGKPRDRITGR